MDFLRRYKEEIDKELKNFLDKEIENAGISIITKEMVENLKEYILRGGKRIRPILIILGNNCFKEETIDVVKASICVELMQSYLLIHDDVIDKDDLRRGGPTIHKIYGKKVDDHFGISMAINMGDLASALIGKSITDSDLEDGVKVKVLEKLNGILVQEIYGQTLDITLNREIKEKDVLQIYRLKTVPYTTEGPLCIGAILGGASKEDIGNLEKFSIPIGLAFQIHDDILGTFGKSKTTGKPNDSDLKEGKKTLLIIKALEKCSEDERKFILKNIGKENLNEEDSTKIREIIEKSGSLDYCRDIAKKYVEEGIKSIECMNLRKEGKENLIELAKYIIERDY